MAEFQAPKRFPLKERLPKNFFAGLPHNRGSISIKERDIQMETEGLRILLVDDEKSMQEVLSVTLRPAGYNLYPVGTGEEALQSFPLARPDLVLLDLFFARHGR